jgi:Ca2+-binding EF-hand superfamily protein
MNKSIALVVGLLISVFSAQTLAESAFSQYDVDGNGVISLEEASVNEALAAQFSELDTDQSGDLSEAEFAKFEG